MRAVDVGLAAIAAFDSYPLLLPGTQARYLSSFDRTGGNDDGFDGTYSALYVDERGEHVLFDEKGPGAVYTMWFTSRENGWAALGFGRLRFYFDDEPTPRLEIDADDLFSGRRPPFEPPFAFHSFTSSGGYVSYLPFPFARRLKITSERRVGFYNIYFHTVSTDQHVTSWTGREDRAIVSAMWNAPGRDPKPAADAEVRAGTFDLPGPSMPDGEMTPSVTRVFEHEGVGTIASIRINPLFPLTAYQLNHITLRMFWDDDAEPSVEVPLGSFFGSGLGETSVRAVPLGMSPSGEYYCYLPMPFWKRARIELVNENADAVPKIWWEVRLEPDRGRYPQAASGYFKATYRKEWPTRQGSDYQILDVRGRGIYVGQVMTVEPVRAEVKRWWEGDLRVFVDARRQPAFHGTGHEDEYLGGWSNEWLMNPYSLPMHGEPATRNLTQVDFQWSAATTVYRFFVAGVPYQSRFVISTEHGVDNAVPAMYSSVAYYYAQSRAMEKADEVDVGDARDETRHRYSARPASQVERLAARFEGTTDSSELADTGRRVGESSRFTMATGGAHTALRLRRLFDQSVRQEAEVWIDGMLAGVWYTATTNTHRRWAEADFLLPPTLTTGKSSLDVELRVRQGPWSEYRYELWAIRP